jgi:hypothetical protein
MSDVPEFVFTILVWAIPVVLLGLGWLGVRSDKWLKTKIKNETWFGMTSRLKDSILDAVRMVSQTLKQEILAAKKPESDGGKKITEEEKKRLKEAVWEALKDEYGGMDGIKKALSILDLGDASWMKWVDSKIEAAVRTDKLAETVARGPQ